MKYFTPASSYVGSYCRTLLHLKRSRSHLYSIAQGYPPRRERSKSITFTSGQIYNSLIFGQNWMICGSVGKWNAVASSSSASSSQPVLVLPDTATFGLSQLRKPRPPFTQPTTSTTSLHLNRKVLVRQSVWTNSKYLANAELISR